MEQNKTTYPPHNDFSDTDAIALKPYGATNLLKQSGLLYTRLRGLFAFLFKLPYVSQTSCFYYSLKLIHPNAKVPVALLGYLLTVSGRDWRLVCRH